MMKKTILIVLSLVILTALGFALNIQPASANPPASIHLDKTGVWHTSNNTINYEFTITNDGESQTLYNVTVSDPLIATITWPAGFSGILIPGQSVVATGTYVVPNISTTEVTNTATAKGQTLEQEYSSPPGGWTTYSDTLPLTKPQDIPPVPELPAGLLFGIGLAGLGTFTLIMRKKAKTSKGYRA